MLAPADAAPISGYLGRSNVFDRAIAAFAETYADQTERDHAALVAAVQSKQLPVETESILRSREGPLLALIGHALLFDEIIAYSWFGENVEWFC